MIPTALQDITKGLIKSAIYMVSISVLAAVYAAWHGIQGTFYGAAFGLKVVDVKPNGVIEVPEIYGLEGDDKEQSEGLRKKIGKVLRVSEDVGMCVEWLLLQLTA